MAGLLELETCPSCGKSHDLFLADDNLFSATGHYEYICPASGVKTVIRPNVANRIVSSLPTDAVTVKRIDLQL